MVPCSWTHRHYYESIAKAPMVWIGIYIGVASLLLCIAMVADIYFGIHHKKWWFPCKYFSLNAASLTLLAIAMKLPVDLSGNMLRKKDQVAKITSTAFMTTAIANFMPSLGTMDDTEILSNVTALGILVFTILGNVCIEIATSIINRNLIIEYILIMFFMLFLFVILSFSALTVPTTRKDLQQKYTKITSTEGSKEVGMAIKDYVKKYWVMAETGSPQFVMARSVTCSASGAICFLNFVVLAEAELRTYFMDSCFYNRPVDVNKPPLNSDYKGSIWFIFLIQNLGVVLGTIGPVSRWFIATKFKCSVNGGQFEWKTENYWIERLVGWRESPLALRKRLKKGRKFVHNTKNGILKICIGVQIVIIIISKAILCISSFLLGPLLSCFHYCRHTGLESEPGTQQDLSGFVLHLHGEEGLTRQIMNIIRNDTDHLIQIGKKQQPRNLVELLGKSKDFNGVEKFDSDQIPSLNSEEPPNCWTLPLVTLTTIATALPNIENQRMKQLRRSMNEGLLYVSLVEKILDSQADLANIRQAEETVDHFRKWFDEDLRKIGVEGKTPRETLEKLAERAENIVTEANMNGRENPNWPLKVIAANSMYRISRTLLLDHEAGSEDQMDHNTLFEQLSVMIADILSACLTNLPRVIARFCRAKEEREKSVQHAARLIGETEEILEILQQRERELPRLNHDQKANINEWRASMKKRPASSSDNVASSSGSS